MEEAKYNLVKYTQEAKYNLVYYTQEAKINLVKYTQEAKYNLVTSCISHMGNTMEGNKIQINYLYNWLYELYNIQYEKQIVFQHLRRGGPTTIWNKVIPLKVRIMNWRARMDRLPTKMNLINRGVVLDNDHCVLCNQSAETGDYIFISCCKATEVMQALNVRWNHFSISCVINDSSSSCMCPSAAATAMPSRIMQVAAL